MKKILLLALLSCAAFPVFSQVDIRVYQQGSYVSMDTLLLTIDTNDNSGTGATNKIVYFNIYNLSTSNAEAFYVEAEWLCSNSSAFYQFCQEYPPDYNSGTCHPFHKEGTVKYDGYNFLIAPDTCSYNYLRCHFFIYDYSVEKEHEKVCTFRIIERGTLKVLDSMYMIIRRGNLPCYESQPGPTGIHTVSAADIVDIYPNPARSYFTIAAKEDRQFRYSLYTTDGKAIFSDRDAANRKSVNISTAELSDGIYYLKLTDKQGRSFYRKIAVDH